MVEWHTLDERPDARICNMVYIRTGRWNLAVVPVRRFDDYVSENVKANNCYSRCWDYKNPPRWAYCNSILGDS